MRPGFVFKVPKYYLTISVLRQTVLEQQAIYRELSEVVERS